MDCIVSRISAMPLLRSTMAVIVCSGVKMTRGAAGAAIDSDGVGTIADVEEDAGGGAVVDAGGGAVAASGGTVVEGRGIDIFDTRLVWTGALPLMDRRLYEWVMVGRGLKMEDRRRGAVISRARKRTEAARANFRLPKEAE